VLKARIVGLADFGTQEYLAVFLLELLAKLSLNCMLIDLSLVYTTVRNARYLSREYTFCNIASIIAISIMIVMIFKVVLKVQ